MLKNSLMNVKILRKLAIQLNEMSIQFYATKMPLCLKPESFGLIEGIKRNSSTFSKQNF